MEYTDDIFYHFFGKMRVYMVLCCEKSNDVLCSTVVVVYGHKRCHICVTYLLLCVLVYAK